MKTILLSEGDPTSINYELISGSLSYLKKVSKTYRIVLVRGNHKIKSKDFTRVETLPNEPGLYALEFSSVSPSEDKQIKLGKPSEVSGRVAYQSLLHAIQLQKETKDSHLITLPLSKEWVIKAGVSGFRGHTETLADAYRCPTFMMMTGKKLKVIPLTTHVPIQKVADELTKVQLPELIKAIRQTKLLKNPKIGLLGLNPHAGEGGKIGDEEQTILSPMIDAFRKAKFQISGPIPGDSAFNVSQYPYDLYLSCYHDQGLIPFKMIEGKTGVNVTLGLDFIRVSPDHGTAFDIAGKGKADPSGLISCLKLLVADR
ncbi:MAG: 4-hydroxythreonine-4-phosphate dehydrogenase PdxA [Leptospira sp.]|nr:4-hydroxythreonine-4-phosphate dehydrogenase PdxA [Leptospira sp.]